ncbi:MAG: alpha/beta fold hydrolase, partial [Pseudomonadota bacterium]
MSRKYSNDVLPTGLRVRHFDSGGAGPPVVLLHGLSNLIEIWDRVIARLSTTFRVIAFDLPGFGASDRPRASYDSEFFSAQLAALLEFYGLKRAHLVGSSLGAGIIVRFSERHLDRIDRAVIAAPGGFGRATHPMMRLPTLPLV